MASRTLSEAPVRFPFSSQRPGRIDDQPAYRTCSGIQVNLDCRACGGRRRPSLSRTLPQVHPRRRGRPAVHDSPERQRCGLSSCGRALLLEAFLVRPFDVVGPAKAFESLDEPGVDVDLSLEYAMACASGVGVVEVVP